MNSICLNISAQFESPIALMLIVHERAALEVFATLYLILSKKLQILSAFLPANNKETRPISCLPRVPMHAPFLPSFLPSLSLASRPAIRFLESHSIMQGRATSDEERKEKEAARSKKEETAFTDYGEQRECGTRQYARFAVTYFPAPT